MKYLKMKKVVPGKNEQVYYRFVGNRFHVYFLSSGMLYTYGDHVKDFFNNVFSPKNEVQRAVLNSLNIGELNVCLRALGLIGKIITGPWMRLVGQNCNILEMNKYFQEAHVNLTKWSEDSSSLLSSNPPSVFSGIPIQKDIVFEKLLQPTEFDGATKELL